MPPPTPLPLACSLLGGERQAGVDEAGCGSLIGSLVAAAVVLPPPSPVGSNTTWTAALRDSKRLSAARRAALAEEVRRRTDVGVGRVLATEIDAHGLAWARRTVFQRALAALPAPPDAVLVDGNGFFDGCAADPATPFRLQPKADGAYANVAAASIVAKEARDALVRDFCATHPVEASLYGWVSNKGYPTAAHKSAILSQGVTDVHRRSFQPCASADAAYPLPLDPTAV